MKIKNPIILVPPKYRNSKGEEITPDPIIIEELEVLHINNPDKKEYYISIKGAPNQILLYSGEFWRENITSREAWDLLLQLSEGDIGKLLQKGFPRTLTNEDGPGTKLRKLLGVYPPWTSALYQQLLVMNERGKEWCREREVELTEKIRDLGKEYFSFPWLVSWKRKMRRSLK